MRVAITGASGLIGSALIPALKARGHDPVALSRAGPNSWMDGAADLSGFDGVIHLAGENVGAKRWSKNQKQGIMDSRVAGTTAIAQASAKAGCKVLISMSASGFYGHHYAMAKEAEPAGDDFLAHVCKAWEAAAQPARAAGLRVVHPRLGVVLTRKGGALARMWLPFKLGAGGPIGNGKQMLPWISLDDTVAALIHCLEGEVEGPVNLAGGSLRQRDFAKALGHRLKRPSFMPLPGFVVGMLFGEMGKTMLLRGQALDNSKLIASGFQFSQPDLQSALATA